MTDECPRMDGDMECPFYVNGNCRIENPKKCMFRDIWRNMAAVDMSSLLSALMSQISFADEGEIVEVIIDIGNFSYSIKRKKKFQV